MICPRCKKEINDDMSFCPQCGMKIEKCQVCHQPIIVGAKYCSHCGSYINADFKESQMEGYYQPLSEDVYNHVEEETTSFQDVEVSKKVNKKVVIIITVIVAIFMLVSYIYLYHGPDFTINSDHQKNEVTFQPMEILETTVSSSQMGNINQGGEVYQDGDMIYICDDQGYLIQMNRQLENRQTIISEQCDYINIVDDTIYYTNKQHQLCSVSTNGENKKLVLNKEIYYLVVKGDKAYYQSQDGESERLYVYDLKNNQETRLNDRKTYNPNVLDDYIYYTSIDGIYRIGHDGQGEEKIIEGDVYNLIYQDGKLYYTLSNNYQIVSYDIDTQKTEVIVEKAYGLINMNEQYIFYMSDHADVVRYDLKTRESIRIYTGSIEGGYIVGDKLILNTSSSYREEQYKIIVDMNGENQQRIFTSQGGDFI